MLNCSTCFVPSVTKLKEFDMAMDNIFFPRKDRQTDRQTFGLIEAPCRSLKMKHFWNATISLKNVSCEGLSGHNFIVLIQLGGWSGGKFLLMIFCFLHARLRHSNFRTIFNFDLWSNTYKRKLVMYVLDMVQVWKHEIEFCFLEAYFCTDMIYNTHLFKYNISILGGDWGHAYSAFLGGPEIGITCLKRQ